MRHYGLLLLTVLLVSGCSDHSRKENTLPAHYTAEKVKEEWNQVSKPLIIRVTDRTPKEQEAIGSIAVWFDGIADDKAVRFNFDGEVFRPATAIVADSTVCPLACYPYQASLHPSDTLKVSSPMGRRLVGVIESTKQNQENIIVSMKLEDMTALLRLRLQSDNICDILKSIGIRGDHIAFCGVLFPFNGSWLNVGYLDGKKMFFPLDCLLNNGFPHSFHLRPTEMAGDVTISLDVNGIEREISVTLPPLRAGSVTELCLNLNKERLSVGSSWVDTKSPFEKPSYAYSDSIKTGYFLQKDGTLSPSLDENTLAWVIQTNGRHGKAVAMEDNSTCNWFCKQSFKTGRIFDTVDGRLREGYLNDPEDDGENIVFSPRVKYPEACALGYENGASLTQAILANATEHAYKRFCEKRVLPSAYIPSLLEMTKLIFYLEEYGDRIPSFFKQPEGFYRTSSESGTDTFYSIDMTGGFITAYNSKTHSDMKTRLFYLF